MLSFSSLRRPVFTNRTGVLQIAICNGFIRCGRHPPAQRALVVVHWGHAYVGEPRAFSDNIRSRSNEVDELGSTDAMFFDVSRHQYVDRATGARQGWRNLYMKLANFPHKVLTCAVCRKKVHVQGVVS